MVKLRNFGSIIATSGGPATQGGHGGRRQSWTPESMLKSLKSSEGGQPREQFERNGKRKYKNEPEEKGKLWWNYGSFGSGAFERGRGRGKGRGNRAKGEAEWKDEVGGQRFW